MIQRNICPCCGQALNAKAAKQIVAEVQLGKVSRRIFVALADHFGAWMSRQKIADIVYGDDPQGGPDSAENIISVSVSKLLPRLERRGLTVESATSAGMRMVWLQDARL